MYKIIGVDGKEYGPITAEQLKQWIAENRANAQTKVLADGATEWKTVADLPEFAAALAARATPPFMGASPPKPDADALAAEILARDHRLEIGSCFSRSWDLLTRHFWLIVGASFVLGLIESAIGLLAGVCMGGLYYLLLKLIRGERAEFGDAFAGFSLAFLQLFLAGLVSGLLTGIGLLLCLLPGIYLAVAWVFTLPLVIDKKMDFWPAMELSRKVVHRHWWVMFGLLLLNLLVCLLGLAACVIGVFIARPLAFGALIFAYEDIFGTKPPPRPAIAA
jgi:hypothetical protein